MAGTTARAALLGAAGTAPTGAAAAWLLRTAVSAWPGSGAVDVDLGVWFLATAAAGLLTAWAAVLLAGASVSLALAGRRAGARPAEAVAPGVGTGLTGRVAAVLLVVAGLGVAPATADEAPHPVAVTAQPDPAYGSRPPAAPTVAPEPVADDDGRAEPDEEEVPVPGWTPTVPPPAPVRAGTAEVGLVSTAAAPASTDEVVVHRGDTLWDIAARHLGEHATDQDVAEAWPSWYAANRHVIGDDPDLIHPGQRLVVPTPGTAR